MPRNEAHQQYHLKSSLIVPGVTTITDLLTPRAPLMHWAWEQGRNGLDYRKSRDGAADTGTIAHYLIACYLRKETPDLSEYPPSQVSKAENSQISFHSWESQHKLKTILVEQQLVSERYRYGGTCDWYGLVDDKATLVDFKSGKAIYPEVFTQVAGYAQLLLEHGAAVEQIRILRIGTEAEDGFTEQVLTQWTSHWRVFRAALLLYKALRDARRA